MIPGEVSHHKPLSSAVAATVWNGKYCWRYVAIYLGGPGFGYGLPLCRDEYLFYFCLAYQLCFTWVKILKRSPLQRWSYSGDGNKTKPLAIFFYCLRVCLVYWSVYTENSDDRYSADEALHGLGRFSMELIVVLYFQSIHFICDFLED
jgi:hypothetical protein